MSESIRSRPGSSRAAGSAALRLIVVGALCAGAGATAVWLWRGHGGGAHEGETGEASQYYCPMHPTYVSDRPGDCPICNMKLVPMKSGPQVIDSGVEGRATIALDEHRRQLIGVRIGEVEIAKVEQSVRAVGRVEYDERRLSAVNLKVGGWVEELFVKSTGEEVRPGDPLFSLYSPELIEAQRNYLLARQAAAHEPEGDSIALASVRAARERLVLLDQGEEQIRALESAGDVPRATTFFAKTGGVVTKRDVVLGARVEAGMDLYELAELSTVWVHAYVYEFELPLVRPGLKAWIQLSSQPGEPISGEVVFVYPYLNEDTRTASVRIEVPNEDRRLKPGMYSTVFVPVDLGEQLVIDDQAVLDTGERQLVFVDRGDGHFEPREVRVGEKVDGGRVIVLDGLSEGEKVVISGNFLVDAESRLKSALLAGSKPSGAGHEGHGK
jgi:RND family efflux transporter MFP subunit